MREDKFIVSAFAYTCLAGIVIYHNDAGLVTVFREILIGALGCLYGLVKGQNVVK